MLCTIAKAKSEFFESTSNSVRGILCNLSAAMAELCGSGPLRTFILRRLRGAMAQACKLVSELPCNRSLGRATLLTRAGG
mmetsp:Transcript_68670/g.108942  ORF Transcript_68670/g.108942 Transcript_68670/m.108942 type:complete len:80 (+) Transcript_68670:168-407(+)